MLEKPFKNNKIEFPKIIPPQIIVKTIIRTYKIWVTAIDKKQNIKKNYLSFPNIMYKVNTKHINDKVTSAIG